MPLNYYYTIALVLLCCCAVLFLIHFIVDSASQNTVDLTYLIHLAMPLFLFFRNVLNKQYLNICSLSKAVTL